MKKILKQIALIFILMNLGLTLQMGIAQAKDEDKDAPSYFGPLKQIQSIGKGTNLPDFVSKGQHPEAPADYLQEGVGTATSPIYYALDFFRYVVSGVALIIIVIMAIKLVSTANDEEAGKAKTTLIVGVIGLLVIQVADSAVKKMFFGEQGEAFEDIATTEIYAKETVSYLRGIIGLVEIFVGAVAVLVIVVRGFLLITSVGDEEGVTKAKKHIMYALVGIAVVVLSEVVVRGVIFPEKGEKLPDVAVGKFIIINITNYLAGFIAILSFAGLFYGGYRYVMAGGKEEMNEKVKKIIFSSLIALILSLGAFALVNTFLQLDNPPTEDSGTTDNENPDNANPVP